MHLDFPGVVADFTVAMKRSVKNEKRGNRAWMSQVTTAPREPPGTGGNTKQ